MKSAHQTLPAIAFGESHAANGFGCLIAFDPQQPTLCEDDLLVVSPHSTPKTTNDAYITVSIDESIPSHTSNPSHTLILSYMYRDASNYKQHTNITITGAYSALDLATLLTVLHANSDGFVPNQIGLFNLQDRMNSDISEDDHIWHEPTYLSVKPQKTEHHVPWDSIRPLLQHILRDGYDEMRAMSDLGIDGI